MEHRGQPDALTTREAFMAAFEDLMADLTNSTDPGSNPKVPRLGNGRRLQDPIGVHGVLDHLVR